MKKYIIVLFLGVYSVAIAQDSLFTQAKKAMNESRWLEAQNLLIQGLKQGGDNVQYSYELAWAYYSNKQYKDVIKVLTPLTESDSAASDIYQLLGNTWDEYGNTNKAVSVYFQGLKLHPKAGNLFVEMGNIKMKEGSFKEALYWYEKGVEADPLYPANYYRAAKVFLSSTEVVWGLMYGEIFMLLEPESERSKDMSHDLFDAYMFAIKDVSGKLQADFDNPVIIYSDSYERKNLLPKVYNSLMQSALSNVRSFSLASLIKVKKDFINRLYQSHPDFDNPLFAYQKELIANGLFDAHCYHLFAYGDAKATQMWISQNKSIWDRYLKHIRSNPIKISKDSYFSRYKME